MANQKPKPWTTADQALAEQLRAGGASYRAIGQQLGRGPDLVRRHLNPEQYQRHQQQIRAWRAAHPEQVRAYGQCWRAAHREQHLEQVAAWRRRNRAHIRLYDLARRVAPEFFCLPDGSLRPR